MAKLQLLKVVNGQLTYYFRGTHGLYDGAIATDTGISIASENEKDNPAYEVAELLQKGILVRLAGITRNSTNGKKGQLRLLCARAKVATVLDELNDKPYSITNGSSGTITSVNFPTRVVSRG